MERYTVIGTAAFDRSARRFSKMHVSIEDILDAMREVLEQDPYNLTRQHHIKKLTDVNAGDGQWRIRVGDFRLRYDIDGPKVVLRSIHDRKDAYR